MIDQGKADFGVIYLPIAHQNLEHIKIASILMGVYKRKGSFKGLQQEQLPFVVPALELCRQGKCAGYFPSFIVDRHNRKFRETFMLERHPYSKSLSRCYSDVFLVKRKDRTEDEDAKMLSKLIRMGTKIEAVD